MDIVVATSNNHKLQELRKILPESFKISGMREVGCSDEIPETGATFRENALQKARYLFEKYHVTCLADDSGLEVKALNGRPGVLSARYAGPDSDSTGNIARLLSEMKGVIDRSARFVTVLALILNGKEYLFEGVINGKITETPSGNGGFGYDPVFIPDGYTMTFSEMTSEQKNSISHRAIAASRLNDFLKRTTLP
jgi:XTP/dITP diphosphohydrolase